jgi:transposase
MDHITKAQIMGLGTKIFIVKEDDSLKRLTLKRYNRLLKGHPDEDLKQYAGKRVRYALIVLEMINRKPVEIIMTEYSYLIFDSKGRLDAGEREKAARLAMDALEPIVLEQKPGKVIDVKHRFAKKRFDDRYLWKPTPEIETAIQRAIFG